MVDRLSLWCVAASAWLCVGLVRGQSLDDLRRELRRNLSDVHFAQSMVGLVLVSDELELSGANYSIDDAVGTELGVYALPFHTSKALWGEGEPRLYLEGTLGWAQARQSTADLYSGQLPGLETRVNTRWRTYGALFGVGLELPLAESLTLTPLVDAGLARVENDARYGGPGAAVTAALVDGIAFNWDALAASYGAGLRVDWQTHLSPRHRLAVVGRYDLRWTETVQEDDAAQDFAARAQLLTLRADLTGPTTIRAFEHNVEWQLNTAFRAFPEQDLFGVDEYVQIGASLLFHTGELIPRATGFAVGASGMFAHDFTGWTAGVRLLF